MRTNLPVVNVETAVPEGRFIYSRTDLHGRILEANDLFVELSGFRREELIGQPHNIVRHPDMPVEAFADLWRCFKDGRPWNGFVKNRRKDGGHYWVHAFASPVRENGKIVGFESVRRRADPAVVASVDALYRRLRAGRSGLTVCDGRVVRAGWRGACGGLGLGWRIGWGMGAVLVLLVAVGGVGFLELREARAALVSLHSERMIPVGALTELRSQSNRARMNLALGAAEGAPAGWHAEQIGQALAAMTTQWQSYRALPHTAAERALIGEFEPLLTRTMGALAQGRERLQQGDRGAALRMASQESVPEYLRVIDLVERLVAQQFEVARAAVNEADRRNAWGTAAVGALLALALGVTGWLYFGVVRGVLRDIGVLDAAIADTQRDGDLRRIVAVERRDELGRLASSFNAMMANTQAIMIKVREGAAQLSAQSGVLAETGGQVAAGAEASSEAASSTAAAVEQVTVAINEVAAHARTAAQAAEASSACAQRGMETARRAAEEIGLLARTVATTTATMDKLAQSSADIGRIATVIKDIAEQTNLLALNAAIEAARAGEQGRGFAVVADEVRKLAERTRQATAEISGILDALRDEMERAVAGVRRGDGQARSGVEQAEAARAALAAIHDATARSLGLVGDIAAATAEQSNAVVAISQNVERIAEHSEEGAAAVGSMASASKALAGVSRDLDRAISRFVV